jgi:RNA-binding protein YhbY
MIDYGPNVSRKRPTKVIQVADTFTTTVLEPIEAISKALLGRKIFIITDDENCKKDVLKRIIEMHSGTCVPNIGESFLLLRRTKTFRNGFGNSIQRCIKQS